MEENDKLSVSRELHSSAAVGLKTSVQEPEAMKGERELGGKQGCHCLHEHEEGGICYTQFYISSKAFALICHGLWEDASSDAGAISSHVLLLFPGNNFIRNHRLLVETDVLFF